MPEPDPFLDASLEPEPDVPPLGGHVVVERGGGIERIGTVLPQAERRRNDRGTGSIAAVPRGRG